MGARWTVALIGLGVVVTVGALDASRPQAHPRSVRAVAHPVPVPWAACDDRAQETGTSQELIASIQAAFDAGADAVAIEVGTSGGGQLVASAPSDGPRAWPWRVTSRHDADVGSSPWDLERGPTLAEVLEALPGRALVLHVTSGLAGDGDQVADVLASLPPAERRRQIVHGSGEVLARIEARLPDVRTLDRGRVGRCLLGYLATGWLGVVPELCSDTWILVPIDHGWLLWGFPERFEARMASVGSDVVLIGPLIGGLGAGIDEPELLGQIPGGFGGWIWTHRIDQLVETHR